jgi:hypothetical protein
MPEQEIKPPKWGPNVDPAPFPPWADPIPWYWKIVHFNPGDPIPFPYRILDQIRIADIIALRHAALDMAEKVIQTQINAEREMLAKQQEILAKYK